MAKQSQWLKLFLPKFHMFISPSSKTNPISDLAEKLSTTHVEIAKNKWSYWINPFPSSICPKLFISDSFQAKPKTLEQKKISNQNTIKFSKKKRLSKQEHSMRKRRNKSQPKYKNLIKLKLQPIIIKWHELERKHRWHDSPPSRTGAPSPWTS